MSHGVFLQKIGYLLQWKNCQSRPGKLRERPKGKQVQSEPDHQGQVVGGGIRHHEDVC